MLIRFASEELQLRGASHNANPLRVLAEYARTAAYGEPVVFGILGAMAAAGYVQERPERVLRETELEFRNPLYAGVDYRIEARKDSDDAAPYPHFRCEPSLHRGAEQPTQVMPEVWK